MKLCGLVAIFSVIGGAAGSKINFTYAVFPIGDKVQHRVPLPHVRSLTQLSLCGWVERWPVFVGEDSSFVTIGDNGQFRLILTQSHAFVKVAGSKSDVMDLPQNHKWYHICVTWESLGGVYKMYRDGEVQISGSDLAAGELLEDISSLTIGNSTDTTSEIFAGRASLFQLYSRALNSSEVAGESCSRRCTACKKYLIASWNLIQHQISRTASVYNDKESPIFLEPPSDVTARLHGLQNIRVSWSNNTDRSVSSQFRWYNVRVSLVNGASDKQNIHTTITRDIVIRDLLKYTWYKVDVSTQSRCGRDTWSNPKSVETKAEPVPVKDLHVLNRTISSITLGWSASGDQDSIEHYRAVIFPSEDKSDKKYHTVDAPKVNHTFTGLAPNTEYTVKIATYSNLGLGQYSSVAAKTLSNRVDPDVNLTMSVEILPDFEVGISWKVSDQMESDYLYQLTIKKLSEKGKRNFNAKKLRDFSANSVYSLDGKNAPFWEVRTKVSAVTIKGLVHYARYLISVAICPDPTSLCDQISRHHKIYVALAEQHYYQQFYSGESLNHQSVQDVVLHATQNSSSLVYFTATNVNPTSFLGKLTFSNQENGRNVTPGEMWYTLLRAQGTRFQNIHLGGSFQLTPVKPSGYCDYVEDVEQGKGNFTWPYVRENTLTVLPCNLTNPIKTENRSRRCDAGGWEKKANYTLCDYSESTSGDIQRLLDTKITNVKEAVEVSRLLTEVTSGTMTTETIGMASQAITQIVSSANNPDISYNTDVARNLAGALGNIQSLDRDQLANEDSAAAAQHIVKDVEAYCLDLTGDDQGTLVNYASPDLQLAVVKKAPEENSDIFIESNPNSDTGILIEYTNKDPSDAFRDKVEVKVPKQLVTPESNVLAVIYKDKSLFLTSDKGLTEAEFNIPILSLSINTVEPESELDKEVIFSLTLNNTARRKPVCVYWNTDDNRWTTEGVEVVFSNDKNIMCKTTHLTSFSALLLPAYDDYILSIISQIGTSVSILCLLATVLLLYIVRSVRECLSTKIHINFALALFLALLFFMINTSTTYPGTYCKVMAGLTHYFFLATFFWMSVEAIGLYRAVVLVFTSASNKTFLIVAVVVAWGVPAAAVAVLLSLQNEVYKIHPNLNICWLSRDWMYGTFFSPLLVMVLFNLLVFFRILGTIIRNRHSQTKGSLKPGQRLVEMRIIFSIMSLLGLTWIFGLIQVSSPHIALEYLFAITNTLQGVAVFVFYCLYNTNIRLALWRVAHGQSLNQSVSNSSQQKRKKKTYSIKQATRQKLDVVKAHIDGNPFAFSFTGTESNGDSTLKKMDRKNWKKLKKHDIKHTNAQLSDSANTKGAIVLAQSRPSSMTMPTTFTTCYSPPGSIPGSPSRDSSPSTKSPELRRYDLTPPSVTRDDVFIAKCRDVISDDDVTFDNNIKLELELDRDKENVYLHGSSEQCSTTDRSQTGSQCSDSLGEPDRSQSSSYEKLEVVVDKEAAVSESIAI